MKLVRPEPGTPKRACRPVSQPFQMSFLNITSVSKAFAGTRALEAASLEVAAGEIHGLMGENGAGKSTLIKILAGVTSPDQLDLMIDGKPVRIASPQHAHGLGFRFIHQELNTVSQLSVAENIILGQPYPTRLGPVINWKSLNQLAAAALAKLHVTHIDPARKAGRLSTGDQMLVRIASTLVGAADTPARLYVLDEPTAALTGPECEKLFDVVREIKLSGAAILYVSHRMDEVMDLCDRVSVFRDGRNVSNRAIADTSKNEIISDVTGRDVNDTYPKRTTPIGTELTCVAKSYATKKITGLDFELRAGEILGLAGLAGSGQSHVLQAVLGLHEPVSGTLEIRGLEGRRPSLARAWANKIGYVPKERRSEGLMLQRSICENATLPHLGKFCRIAAVVDGQAQTSFAQGLGKQVALKSEGPAQPCYQLSGGNQQKVVFARAIGDAPRLLLLDEPTRGVDIGAKQDIYSLIRELTAAGTSVLLTSSDLPELLGLCDRMIVLKSGVQHSIVNAADYDSQKLLQLFHG